MQEIIKNIAALLNNNIVAPSVLINEDGVILNSNNMFREEYGGDFSEIFEIITEPEKQDLKADFQEVCAIQKPYSIGVRISKGSGEISVQAKISPLRIDNNKFLIITFYPVQTSGSTGEVSFNYISEEIEEALKDSPVSEIIKKIKSNFPFTLIEKKIIQNEIDKINEFFWIKNISGKFVLVNKSFAKFLGGKVSQVENQPEEELLPKYLFKIIENTNTYIKDTGNSVIIDGVGQYLAPNSQVNVKIVQFPITDIDNVVTAIVGFTLSEGNPVELSPEEKNTESEISEKRQSTKNKTESYDMLELILDKFPLPIFIYDIENLKFLEVNPAALELYGFSKEEFLNMDLTDLYAPEDIQSLIDSKGNSGNKFVGPWRQKKKDGSSVYVEIGKINVEYEGRKAHLSVIKDVTEKFELEKKIQLYKSLFNNSSDSLVITDRHGFIKFINDSFTKYFGYSKSELEQNPFVSLAADEFRRKLNKEIFQSNNKNLRTLEIKLKESSGNITPVKITAVPIIGFNEEIERYSLIIFPKYKSKESRDYISELKGKGIDANFLSNLFHELLTPLNVIIGFVQELADSIERPSEDQREAIQIIKENQKVLMQTMDTAIEYSHLEQNIIELKPVEIAFVDLLEQLEEYLKKSMQSYDVKLNYGKISSSLKFTSDRQKFLTFLVQVFQFAVMMTNEQSIYISANYYGDDSFYVGIKDSKSKISHELVNHLRSVFIDDENLIRQNFGLSRFTVRLAKKLLDILGAEFKAIPSESSPQEFALIFPLKLKAEEKLAAETTEIKEERKPDVAEKIREVYVPPFKQKELDLSSLSCLYLEDQIDSQILFKVQMKELRTIEFASSLEKALPLLKSKHFDFILMDINLQGEYNGLDALKIIRELPGYKRIPIIAVTAYVVPGAAEKFIQAGFDEFINKPLLREKIIDALKKVFA